MSGTFSSLSPCVRLNGCLQVFLCVSERRPYGDGGVVAVDRDGPALGRSVHLGEEASWERESSAADATRWSPSTATAEPAT